MSARNHTDAGEHVEHGAVEGLFPVESLDADVVQHRDAQLRLADVDPDAVVAVAPTGVASGYFLRHHPLTAIRVRSLPGAVRQALAEAGVDADAVEYLQVGGRVARPANHTLAEYAGAG